ncbi:hypothetical protein ABIF54_006000 [Bradyrhizobium japonicum]
MELDTDRLETVPVFSVITPPGLIEDPEAPESASILPSRVVMLSVMLIWFGPEAPEAMKVSVWPLTVMVSAGGPAEKPDESTSAPPAVALPLSTVAPVSAGEDSTLPPRVTLLMPSAVAAVPLPIDTSVPVPVEIWMLPLAESEAVTPAPPAVWIAFRMLATVAVVPAPRPIVVLLPTVETVVPPLKVIVLLPLIVRTWPLSAVRMLEARCVPTVLSRDVEVEATADELFWSGTVPVPVVDE